MAASAVGYFEHTKLELATNIFTRVVRTNSKFIDFAAQSLGRSLKKEDCALCFFWLVCFFAKVQNPWEFGKALFFDGGNPCVARACNKYLPPRCGANLKFGLFCYGGAVKLRPSCVFVNIKKCENLWNLAKCRFDGGKPSVGCKPRVVRVCNEFFA